ncbi:MAG TPA: ABC transporter permease [Candidatus Acidoferrum sp.]|nr:ABC transporter permease [Candidatus Acidoferrum sp.]
MKNAIALTINRMRLMLRNRLFLFFSLVMPMVFLFLFLGLFARGNAFVLPVMLAQVIAITVMGNYWGLSVQLVMWREQGILRRYRLAPVRASDLLISSIFANYVLTLPTIIIEFVLARLVFHVLTFGNLWTVFLLTLLGTVCFASMGLIIASVTNTMQETQLINQLIWFVLLFLSGATLPIFILGKRIAEIAYYLPATYLVVGLQRAMLHGAGAIDLIPVILSLIGTGLIAFILSSQLFRWDPDDKAPRKAKLWVLATIVPFFILGYWESHHANLTTESQSFFHAMEQQRQQPPPPAQAPPSQPPR